MSVGNGGVEADHESHNGSLSLNGRYVAFQSTATNLVPNDFNGLSDIFVLDRWTGAVERISVAPSGAESNGSSACPSWSLDEQSRWLLFASSASNLAPGGAPSFIQLFVWDRITRVIERVTYAWDGTEPDWLVPFGQISPDGRLVVFESEASNLVPGDANDVSDVFVRNRIAGTNERVSAGDNGQEGNDASGASRQPMSRDGRFVTFDSLASNLVPGDTNGCSDVFVRDRSSGTLVCASRPSPGVQADRRSWGGALSADGRYVAFESLATNLVPGVANGKIAIYVRDLQSGAITRVSVDSNGLQGDANSGTASISSGGLRVAFQSYATNLVPGDTNGACDVFVHDLVPGTTRLVSRATSGAQGSGYAGAPRISSDGRHVSFESLADDLVPNDANGTWDVFLRDTLPTTPEPYCTPKVNSLGCTPVIAATGQASLSDPAPFLITVREVINRRPGALLYGFWPAGYPYGGGWFCIGGDLRRLDAQNTGGSSAGIDCSGVLAVDFRARIQSPAAAAFQLGRVCHVQFLYRDPGDPLHIGLSSALSFPILP